MRDNPRDVALWEEGPAILGRVYVSQGKAFVILSKGFVPHVEAFVPQGEAYVPHGEGFVPQGEGFVILSKAKNLYAVLALTFIFHILTISITGIWWT